WSSRTKNLTGKCSRAAVEISIADIRKQPSPVIVTTCRSPCTRWAPRAAPIDQPIAWLFVGLKNVRGSYVVNTSAAQYCDTVTSTNAIALRHVVARRARKNSTGSTPQREYVSQ